MNENSKSIKHLLNIKTDSHTIKELLLMVKYTGSIRSFRMFIWKHKIPYKKERTNTKELKAKINKDKEAIKKMTVEEIKTLMNYKGSANSLFKILKQLNIKYIRATKYRKDIRSKIKLCGDTSKLTPQEIFNKIDVQVINPTSYLRRIDVPYKKR